MAIPEALRITVLDRIAALNPAERRIVMCASAIGRTFDVSLLAAVARCRVQVARIALDHACALQLVEDASPAAGRYAFRHALTRTVIYEVLQAGGAQPVHRRIALALERRRTHGR